MAQCKDCIHFEVCNPFVSPNESFPEIAGCKCFKTAEEVAQEYEMNRVISLTEKFLLEDQEARYKTLMAEHDREVASEIFEEIDDLLIQHAQADLNDKHLYIDAELKKKYTESEDKI